MAPKTRLLISHTEWPFTSVVLIALRLCGSRAPATMTWNYIPSTWKDWRHSFPSIWLQLVRYVQIIDGQFCKQLQINSRPMPDLYHKLYKTVKHSTAGFPFTAIWIGWSFTHFFDWLFIPAISFEPCTFHSQSLSLSLSTSLLPLSVYVHYDLRIDWYTRINDYLLPFALYILPSFPVSAYQFCRMSFCADVLVVVSGDWAREKGLYSSVEWTVLPWTAFLASVPFARKATRLVMAICLTKSGLTSLHFAFSRVSLFW